jgi:hypothetical protein
MTNPSAKDIMDRLNARYRGISLEEARHEREKRAAEALAELNAFKFAHPHWLDVTDYEIWDTPEGYDRFVREVSDEVADWIADNIKRGGAAHTYGYRAYLGFDDINDAIYFKLRWA